MKKYCSTLFTSLFAVILFVAGSFSANAQLAVNNTMTPEQLVQNVLLGQGVTAFNVTYNGSIGNVITEQAQQFDATGAPLIGINGGVILATGDAALAIGPNNQSGAGLGGGNFGQSDPDLVAIAGVNINDAAVLEFDFIPVGDTLRFRYVFSSEEYLEFVGGGINDAFGFFLSGPGINGPYTNNADNIALIPGTTMPVSIDNVNDVNNPAYYVDNGDGFSPPQNTDVTVVQYDGHTVVLEATAIVQCGQTYHIKLAIGDGADTILDSGVFLEENSFSSSVVQVELATGISSDSMMVEGCGFAIVDLIRPDVSTTDTIIIQIGGNAINGVDYAFLNDSVIFQAGVDTMQLIINPFADGIVEPADTLIITTFTISPCGDTLTDVGVVYIVDSIPFAVDAPDYNLTCPADSVAISAISLGDPQDYTYDWSDGTTQLSDTGSVIWVPMPTSVADTFYVSVTDTCGTSTTVDTVIINANLPPPLTTTASNDTTTNCANLPANVASTGTDGTPPYTYQWSSGATTSATTVTPAVTTTYYITITDACGDTSIDSVQVTVQPMPPQINITNDTTVLCSGDGVILQANGTNGAPPYSYQWDTGQSGNQIFVFPTGTTTYTVGVTDACNAIPTNATVTVTVPTYPALDAGLTDQTVVCAGDVATLGTNFSGGAGGYTWVWNDGSNNPSITVGPNATTTYNVTVTDQCGADTTQFVTVTVPTYDPISVVIAGDPLICVGNESALLVSTTGGAGGYSWTWSGSNLVQMQLGNAVVSPLLTETYSLIATDQCGAQGADQYTVEVEVCEVHIPNVFSPNGDGYNDFLVIQNIEKFPGNNVQVFNRWGKKIYEASNYGNDWTAPDVADGTYYLIVTLDEEREPYSGHVTLTR